MAKKGLDYPPPPPRGGDDEFLSSPDSPEKNRRAFAKIEQGSDEPAVQVETKPGLAWTEPEPSAPAGRERKKPEASGDTEPPIQVETKAAKSLEVEAEEHKEIEEKTQPPEVIPLDDIKKILQAELERNSGVKQVNTLEIEETGEGVHLHIEIGIKGGKATVKGLVVNGVDGLVIKDLDVDAPFYARSTVRASFTGFGAAVKTHFEEKYGKPISNIQVGKTGLTVEFAPPTTAEPATVEPVEPDGRIEPELGPEVEQQEDTNTQQEGTPKENRSRFLEVMARAKEKFGWYSSSEEHLIRRNEELDAQMEAIGGKLKIERGFRWIGEKYNKLPFKYKLALGATLGLGTVLSAGTLAVAFPLLGIAGQRAAGLASMYMKFEKQSHDEAWGKNKEWGKQKAMLKAGVYTVLIGLTMKEAIEYASETEIAHAAQAKVEGFLGYMMGHKPVEEFSFTFKPTVSAQEAVPSPAVQQAAAPEVSAPATPVPAEVPKPAAAAAAGEQVSRPVVQGMHRPEAPTRFEMPKHADFSIHEDDTTISPYDVTPTNQSGTEEIGLADVEEAQTAEAATETTRSMQTPPESPAEMSAPVAEPEKTVIKQPTEPAMVNLTKEEVEIPSTSEAPVTEPPPPLQEVDVVSPEPIQTVEVTTSDRDFAETPATSETLPPAPTIEHTEAFINKNELPIDPLQGHVFQDKSGALLAYGNDFNARFNAAQEFAKTKPGTSVWVQAEKPVFYEGAWRPWVFEVKYGGWWRGMQILGADGPTVPSQIGGIDPNTFIKQLDK